MGKVGEAMNYCPRPYKQVEDRSRSKQFFSYEGWERFTDSHDGQKATLVTCCGCTRTVSVLKEAERFVVQWIGLSGATERRAFLRSEIDEDGVPIFLEEQRKYEQ